MLKKSSHETGQKTENGVMKREKKTDDAFQIEQLDLQEPNCCECTVKVANNNTISYFNVFLYPIIDSAPFLSVHHRQKLCDGFLRFQPNDQVFGPPTLYSSTRDISLHQAFLY